MATTETPDTKTSDAKTVGRIEEIQGVVVEVTFPNDELPEIYNAITVMRGDELLTLEVQQHLGDDRVRCVAMDSTDGLARGRRSPTPVARSPCPSARACSAGS